MENPEKLREKRYIRRVNNISLVSLKTAKVFYGKTRFIARNKSLDCITGSQVATIFQEFN